MTRGDVLKAFLKSDKEIAALVVEEVVRRCLWEDPPLVGMITRADLIQIFALPDEMVRVHPFCDLWSRTRPGFSASYKSAGG
jgi:CBS domain-containing protein